MNHKKMMKYAAASMAMLAVGCSDGNDVPVPGDKEITFAVTAPEAPVLQPMGRAELTGSNLSRFRCFAFYGNSSDLYIDNATVGRNTGAGTQGCWWETATQYWPKTGGALHFYATAPAEGGYTPVREADGAVKVKGFSVPDVPTTDFVYASARDQWWNTASGNVHLEFCHALCAVRVYIENYSEHYSIGVRSVEFNNLLYKGDFTMPASGSSKGGDVHSSTDGHNMGVWSVVDERRNFTAPAIDSDHWQDGFQTCGPKAAGSANPTVVSLMTGANTVFMMPQALYLWQPGNPYTGDWRATMVLSTRITETNYGTDITNDATGLGHSKIVIPLTPYDGWTWYPNKLYNIYIRFGNNGDNMGFTTGGSYIGVPISIKVQTIENWGTAKSHWILPMPGNEYE